MKEKIKKNIPKISIIIPTYNSEKYISTCIESAINQTLKEIEIIIGDGGSTDSTIEIINEYAKYDERIIVLCNLGAGYGESMNEGIRIAKGEYIGIVESDDFVKENMFETLYLKATICAADIVKSDFICFKNEGIKVATKYQPVVWKLKDYNRIITPREEMRIFHLPINTWCGIYRKEFLEKYQIWHNNSKGASYQDNGFWFQTLALANRVVFVPKAFYWYRQDNPYSSINNKKKVFSICEEYNFIYKKMEEWQNNEVDLKAVYWAACFGAYWYALNRIDPSYRYDFLVRFHEDFLVGQNKNELNKKAFYSDSWDELYKIMQSPNDYYLEKYSDYCIKGMLVKKGFFYRIIKLINNVNKCLKKMFFVFKERGYRYIMYKVFFDKYK